MMGIMLIAAVLKRMPLVSNLGTDSPFYKTVYPK